MLRNLFFLLIMMTFMVGGFVSPFVFSLGYVWVTIIRPQDIGYGFVTSMPSSMLFSIASIAGYFLLDRKYPPKISAVILLMIILPIWITITTQFFAVAPQSAWAKWDWAFKTVVFAAFMVLFYRSRIQIEAFLQIFVFSISAHVLAAGGKTLMGGGGYGNVLGLMEGNSLLAEGATLATVALMIIPIVLFLMQHNQLFPKIRLVSVGYIGIIVFALAGAVGTYQRTALVGLVVLGGATWLRSNRKILYAVIVVIVAAGILYLVSDQWLARMDTIDNPTQEASALGRLLAWRWTLQFVLSNPFGGGFEAYRINSFQMPSPDGGDDTILVTGKAFHSIYFEMLGEHGWPGLFILLALIGLSFVNLQRVVSKTSRLPNFAWANALAKQLQVSLLVLVTCGAFIGIAFQPMLYFMFSIIECLNQHVRRCLVDLPRHRPVASAAASGPALAAAGEAAPAPALREGWRARRAKLPSA